jgi:antitoxin HicB
MGCDKCALWEVRSTAAKPEDRKTDSVLFRADAHRAPRLHQEDPEDTRAGSRLGETEKERGNEMKKRNKHIGSSLDDFLKEEGVLEETRAIALKEAFAWQVQQAMEKGNISKVEMARRMKTSRAALDRFLAPGNSSVTLQTLTRAARAIGRDLRIELV